MSSKLEIHNIELAYDGDPVVREFSMRLAENRIGCLLGPSGCGKTTLLRAIAGFEKPRKGTLAIDGRPVSGPAHHLEPEQRHIGMVFQDFSLFPHMSVADNIRFGLRQWSRDEQRHRTAELLQLIGLGDRAGTYPHELSGGQQQRVALARALAPRPSLLLLDEPFSSLDVELREQLAREVRGILRQENITAILVTHDQHEAFAMADEICVMNQGRIQQQDSAYNLYHKPANRFVADFIGEGVFIPGEVRNDCVCTELGEIHGLVPGDCRTGCKVDVLIRPDDIVHDDAAPERAVIVDRAFRGSEFLCTLRMPSGMELLCLVPSHHDHEIGESMGIRLDFRHLVIFPAAPGN